MIKLDFKDTRLRWFIVFLNRNHCHLEGSSSKMRPKVLRKFPLKKYEHFKTIHHHSLLKIYILPIISQKSRRTKQGKEFSFLTQLSWTNFLKNRYTNLSKIRIIKKLIRINISMQTKSNEYQRLKKFSTILLSRYKT